MRGPHNPMTLNSQRMSRLTLRDKPPLNSSSDEAEVCCSPGPLVFEYFEQEQPHHRPPLYDKASPFSLWLVYWALSSFICFLLTWVLVGSYSDPAPTHIHRFQILHLNFQSWGCTRAVIFCLQVGFLWLGMFTFSALFEYRMSVWWLSGLVPNVTGLCLFNELKPGSRYPIYRIPVGPTLQSLDASFLTFHSLSTNSRSIYLTISLLLSFIIIQVMFFHLSFLL